MREKERVSLGFWTEEADDVERERQIEMEKRMRKIRGTGAEREEHFLQWPH